MRELPRYDRTVSAAHRRFVGVVSATTLLFALAGVAPVSAAERVHLDIGVARGEEGSTVELARLEVDAEHVGTTCTVRAHTENQSSVHPGNDLLVTTGDSRAVIADVEAEPDSSRDLSDQVVLGESVVIQLRFGPDQVSSMGYDLEVDCGTDDTVLSEPDGSTEPADEDDSVAEVNVPPPALPEPCVPAGDDATDGQGSTGATGSSGDGSFTVDENGCPTGDDPDGDDGDGSDPDGPGATPGSGTILSGTTEPTTTVSPSDDAGADDSGSDATESGRDESGSDGGDGSGADLSDGSTATTIPGSSGDSGPTATVLGVQQLPNAGPAIPVQANPTYAG